MTNKNMQHFRPITLDEEIQLLNQLIEEDIKKAKEKLIKLRGITKPKQN